MRAAAKDVEDDEDGPTSAATDCGGAFGISIVGG